MKKLLLSTLFLLLAGSVFAQKGSVAATVINAETREGVVGAVLEFAPADGTAKSQFTTSLLKGAASLPSLAYGEYTLTVSFLGYTSLEKKIKIDAAKVDLGELELKQGIMIETVVKEAQALRTSQRGDTVSYNAGAFKVSNDSDVEGLLKKMPGLTVTDGKVEAQGESVKKVFVDGKEFFGDDVTTAIRSLPAQSVDRIEVYNKLSDNAEFSGMDDGDGFKALNIVTHSNMRQGQFGKLYAGIGYDADTQTEDKVKYLAGGNVNIFSGDSRVTVLGLFNNINQQNFSFQDILNVSGAAGGGGGGRGVGQYMVRPQSGVATVNLFGLNYSDTWGKSKQLTFQGNYLFNNTDTRNYSTTDRWYEMPSIDTLSTRGESDTDNFNHRLNARLEWKISSNQNLMIRPRFSYQSNDPLSRTYGWQYGALPTGSGYSYIDNMNDGTRSGYNIGTSVVYRAKLGKEGRTITLSGDFGYQNNKSDVMSYSNQERRSGVRPVDDPDVDAPWGWDPANYTMLRYLRNLTPSSNYSLEGEFTYTEPVSKYSQVSLQYRADFQNEENDKSSYITQSDYSIAGLTPESSLSSSYSSDYLRQSVGPGFRWSKNRNTFVANVFYQYSNLDGMVLVPGGGVADEISRSYNNVTYFTMGQWNINRENSLRMFISSRTSSPRVTQLQSVFDISDAQYISSGNPDLNPTYTHRANLFYTNSNMEKGRTFMLYGSMQVATDYITTDVRYNGTVDIPNVDPAYAYLQYTRPINMDGFLTVMAGASYGFPLKFMKSNLNLSAGVNYTKMPSMIDDQRNDTKNMGYNFGTVLGSNISEKVDFTFSWNGTYNEATNTLDQAAGKNRYFYHVAQANMKFVLPLGFTFTGSVAYTQYVGFTNPYDDNYLLCNAWIGKKLFKNQQGEIMFGVNDILNQNTAFSRVVGSGWTQNSINSVIGRYYMLQFTYNLRRFGKNASTNLKDYEGMVGQPGQPGQGGPGGAGGRRIFIGSPGGGMSPMGPN